MRPERWKEIERIFHSVLTESPEKRTSVLDSSCGGDEELRREVQLLLDAEESAGSFLQSRKLPRTIGPPADEQPGSAVGRTLGGHYEILSLIGAGSMGEVYLARDTRLSRNVAVKLLPTRFTGDGERVTRFMREANAASALNHPNIVTVYDGGEVDGEWFIATEYIEGANLRQKMAGKKPTLAEALDIAIQAALALDAGHAAGVLHRDIKPENIMIRPDGLVKIVDFGLAQVSGSLDEPGLTGTQAGTIMGTPRYMSPEQARAEKLDSRTDIFSLGAVLYEMAAERPAFPGSTTADVLAALLTINPPPVPDSELNAIISKALAKQREPRYQTMREFAGDLVELKQRVESGQLRGGRRFEGKVRAAAVLCAALLLIVAVAVAWNWRSRTVGAPTEAPLAAVPLTSFAGFKDYPSLSPDGTKVAFAWNGGAGGSGSKQERNIYIMPLLAGSEPAQLTRANEDNMWPAWSPDGQQIAFSRFVRESDNSVYVVAAGGGPERFVTAAGNGVSWLPDSKTLVFPGKLSETGGIFLYDLGTGNKRQLTSPKPQYDNRPAASPDGRWIAFTRGSTENQRQVCVVSTHGGEVKALTPSENQIVGLTWTADSRGIVYSSRHYGPEDGLWRVSLDGGAPQRLPVTRERAQNPSISLRGGKLAFTESALDTNIYRWQSTGAGTSTFLSHFGSPQKFIASTREDHSAAFSPDGRSIAYISTRSGGLELWKAQQDGSQAVELTFLRSPSVGTPRWSPDGRWISYDCRIGANTEIQIIAADGGSPRQLTTGLTESFLPAWSSDGKWVYFTSNHTGVSQIWRIPAAGGKPIQITHGGARESLPSPDGKVLYFTRSRPESGIWSVPVEGGSEEPVPELKPFTRVARAWGVIPQGIYFISREDNTRQQVRFFSFATRSVTVIATLDKEPTWNVPALAISPDGRSLLSVHIDHELDDLMLVENFR